MATLISDANIINPRNLHIPFDQHFDLDEVLTLAEIPIQHDYNRHDHDHHDEQIFLSVQFEFEKVQTVADVDSCAVCMESFNSGEVVERIPCGHVYHAGCVAAWLSVCNSCPLCRCQISPDDRSSRGGKNVN